MFNLVLRPCADLRWRYRSWKGSSCILYVEKSYLCVLHPDEEKQQNRDDLLALEITDAFQ